MAKTHRNCRRSSRAEGLSDTLNYHSTKAFRRAKKAWQDKKKARKLNFRIRKARR